MKIFTVAHTRIYLQIVFEDPFLLGILNCIYHENNITVVVGENELLP